MGREGVEGGGAAGKDDAMQACLALLLPSQTLLLRLLQQRTPARCTKPCDYFFLFKKNIHMKFKMLLI